MHQFDPTSPVDTAFCTAIACEIDAFLSDQAHRYADVSTRVSDLYSLARDFTAGGKRIRPAFCYWSCVAATDTPPTSAVLRVAASLDVLHVSALMHDDVMDASATRRGLPAAHVQYAKLHAGRAGTGSSEAFGRAAAILLGDLLLTLSAELYDTAGLTPTAHARGLRHLHSMRTEVALGQFLDVSLQSLPTDPVAQLEGAVTVTEYKTARYSVRRPCQIGGAIAGADDALDEALAAFGSPLGRAFQLRDDLLGIFGDPEVTGKPAGDDLREGKRTVLVSLALANATPASADRLKAMLGDPSLTTADIDAGRDIIMSSGARTLVEQRIDDEYDAAMSALEFADLTVSGRTALTRLAELSTRRDH